MSAATPSPSPHLRIGEVSRRVGVPTAVLRVWEERYGVVEPARSPAGYRLYSDEDVRRIGAMKGHVGRGIAPAEAARLARDMVSSAGEPETVALERARVRLRDALDAWDGETAGRTLDRLLLTFGITTALRSVVLPYLRELGERWASGEVTVAHEHFASTIVRSRLVAAAIGWEEAPGPLAVLACAESELHDVALVAFGLALHGYHGWRIAYLGADTPVHDLESAAVETSAFVVVVSAVDPARFSTAEEAYARLARAVPLAIAGAGATPAVARRLGADLLGGDPIAAAEAVAARFSLA